MDFVDYVRFDRPELPGWQQYQIVATLPLVPRNRWPMDTIATTEMQMVTSYVYGFTSKGIDPLNFLLDEQKLRDKDKRVRMQRVQRAFREAPTGVLRILAQRCLKPPERIPERSYLADYMNRNVLENTPVAPYDPKSEHLLVHNRPLLLTWNTVDANTYRFPRADSNQERALRTCLDWIAYIRNNQKRFRRLTNFQRRNYGKDATHGTETGRSIYDVIGTVAVEEDCSRLFQLNVVMALMTDYPGLVEHATDQSKPPTKKRAFAQI